MIDSALTDTVEVREPYEYPIEAQYVEAEYGPISFSASGLPTGLTINTSTGVISGTPVKADTYTIALGATNVDGTGTASLVLVVAIPGHPPLISGVLGADGVVGESFSYEIEASGNVAGYAASKLPPGLSIDTVGGVISGTPTTSGTFNVAISARNEAGIASAGLLIIVATDPPVATIAATVPEVGVESGQAGVFTVSLPAKRATSLDVSYMVKGSAQSGIDYIPLSGTVTIKAGKKSRKIDVSPLGDLCGAAKKTVKVILDDDPDGIYTVGTPDSAKVKIVAGQ